MQLQDRYDTLETRNSNPLADPLPLRSLSNYRGNFMGLIKKSIRRLSIKQKIGYGYALAIGIAVLGTSSGLVIGDHYQQKAKEQLTDAHQQQRLLVDLQHEVLAARSHQQKLVPFTENFFRLESETRDFFEKMQLVGTLLSDLQTFGESNDSAIVAIETSQVRDLWKLYEATTQAYSELLNFRIEQHHTASVPPEKIQQAHKELLVSINEDVGTKLEQLYEELNQTIRKAKTQENVANVMFNKAESLRRKITIISMLLSVAIAAILAYYTSRAIACPIEWVTQVAQRATLQSNYKLRAPVLTEDEAGLLAISLNQLIVRVAEQIQEIQQTQAQLIQTEKMSSLGQLVAGVAHEINNPVNFISGNIEHSSHYIQDLLELVLLYQQEYPNPTPAIQELIDDIDLEFLRGDLPNLLESMTSGANRIRQIVVSLRNFSRLDEAEKKRVDVHEGIDSTLLMLNHRFKSDIEVIKHYGDLPRIECYPAQLNQVFMHLIANAIDALEERKNNTRFKTRSVPIEAKDLNPTLTIARSLLPSSSLQNPQIVIETTRVGANQIEVRIRDNALGIPPEIKGKLFDPFFTTKAPGKGTGLGLAVCYQIIQKHGGKIEVFSEPGQGSEFTIALPIKFSLSNETREALAISA